MVLSMVHLFALSHEAPYWLGRYLSSLVICPAGLRALQSGAYGAPCSDQRLGCPFPRLLFLGESWQIELEACC